MMTQRAEKVTRKRLLRERYPRTFIPEAIDFVL